MIQIAKFSDEQQIAWGIGSVISERGVPVIDTQGDVIDASELEAATTEYMKGDRKALADHAGNQIGTVIHSFPLTADIAKALGITCDREAWLVGMHISDPATWQRVKSGASGFSFGGTAHREGI